MSGLLLTSVLGLILAVSPWLVAPASAQVLDQIFQFGCANQTIPGLPCMNIGDVLADSVCGGEITTAFNGFLFLMLVVYGIRLIAKARSDDSMSEAMTSYSYALVGAVIASFSFTLTAAFIDSTGSALACFPPSTGGDLPDMSPIAEVLVAIVVFLANLAFSLLVLNIVIQGIRMIIAQDDGGVQAAQQNLIRSFIGVILLHTARVVIPNLSTSNPQSISVVLVGLANFLATIFGALAVIGIIVAGIMLVISVDEGLKDRAKKLIIASLAALVVVLLAKGIISFIYGFVQ